MTHRSWGWLRCCRVLEYDPAALEFDVNDCKHLKGQVLRLGVGGSLLKEKGKDAHCSQTGARGIATQFTWGREEAKIDGRHSRTCFLEPAMSCGL